MRIIHVAALAALTLTAAATPASPPQATMSFFITSAGPGSGAELHGLAGADRHCAQLAAAVGAAARTWRAYLSTVAMDGQPAVNARDRIGKGPWYNAKGVMVASDVEKLHGDANLLNKENSLTEKGEVVNGRGDTPNMHDILTGSSPDGRAVAGANDTTCGNWTRSGEGSAIVGHHDRIGLRDDEPSRSWNSSHPSRGCGIDALKATGGNGYFYCFASR
ncbi:MAG: lectin [Gemmatimonadota bacterium]|nr:lectin [Gemmatimonadota bacterium]